VGCKAVRQSNVEHLGRKTKLSGTRNVRPSCGPGVSTLVFEDNSNGRWKVIQSQIVPQIVQIVRLYLIRLTYTTDFRTDAAFGVIPTQTQVLERFNVRNGSDRHDPLRVQLNGVSVAAPIHRLDE
jgi:hypothetical protein